jgi:hypothetical protein
VQYAKQCYGPRLAALLGLDIMVYLISTGVATVFTFVYPPFGLELVSAGLCIWNEVCKGVIQSGVFISRREKQWLTRRISMVIMLTACWLEVRIVMCKGMRARMELLLCKLCDFPVITVLCTTPRTLATHCRCAQERHAGGHRSSVWHGGVASYAKIAGSIIVTAGALVPEFGAHTANLLTAQAAAPGSTTPTTSTSREKPC